MYVVADMLEAKILYEDVSLKQSAIMIAHHIAEGKQAPENVINYDTHFASKLFEIHSAKSMIKLAQKEHNEEMEVIYLQRLEDAHHLADDYKARIQEIFQQTFRV